MKKLKLPKKINRIFIIPIILFLVAWIGFYYFQKNSIKTAQFVSNLGYSFNYPESYFYITQGYDAMGDTGVLLENEPYIAIYDNGYGHKELKNASYRMTFAVLDDPENLVLTDFVKTLIEKDNAKINQNSQDAFTKLESMKSENINGIDIVSIEPGKYYEYSFVEYNKGKAFFMKMKNGKILQVAYPSEFCNEVKIGTLPGKCYKDVRNNFMEHIFKSVSFN
ncbi:hypothetical protein KBC75_04560 [Candidatus Shapirobacteria bacterium]|nr:hypothetical protein [Candidatus Shapirobacteria bacterium]